RMTDADRARLRDLLDLHEGGLDLPLLDAAGITELLTTSHRHAMIGASANPTRPSNGVLRYLLSVGYDVVPVNPMENRIENRPCYPALAAAVAAEGRVDIVDVFRRAELCVPHAEEAVAVGARCLWLQLG